MKIGQKPELPGALAQTGVAKQAKSPASAAEGAVKDAAAVSTAGVPVTVFGAKETTHTKINADLGRSDDPATTALFAFVEKALK